MTLITRCPTCATTFKVVPDQLKVSDGWVRCGRCQAVFDAAPHLTVLEAADVPVSTPDAGVAEVLSASLQPASLSENATEPLPVNDGQLLNEEQMSGEGGSADQLNEANPVDLGVLDAEAEVVAKPDASDGSGVVANSAPFPSGSAARDRPDEGRSADHIAQSLASRAEEPLRVSASSVESSVRGSASEPIEPVLMLDASAPASAPSVAGSRAFDVPVPAPDPAWARNEFSGYDLPKQRQRWPWVLGSVALVLVLLGQFALHARDALAAQHALLRPWLVTLCGVVGCEVRPLRQIDGLVIESSSFERIRGNVYQLSFALRNRTGLPLARPSVELTLTDRLDKAKARRVWSSQELTGSPGLLPPGGEWVGQYAVSVEGEAGEGTTPADARMSGYTVGIFYP